jgi:hypothetical protein
MTQISPPESCCHIKAFLLQPSLFLRTYINPFIPLHNNDESLRVVEGETGNKSFVSVVQLTRASLQNGLFDAFFPTLPKAMSSPPQLFFPFTAFPHKHYPLRQQGDLYTCLVIGFTIPIVCRSLMDALALH